MTPEAQHCPFCRSTHIVPCHTTYTAEEIPVDYHQQTCLNCGARGPRTDLKFAANKSGLELWNLAGRNLNDSPN
jgi:hypothetical protein